MSVKFQTNIPLLLHFPFGDAKETQGQYGVQYQYTVNHEHAQGQKDHLYATPTLHAHLSAVGPDLRGRSMWITKKEEGTRKFFEVCYEDGTPVEEPAHDASAPAASPPPPPRPAGPPSGPPKPPAARPAAPVNHATPATAPTAAPGPVTAQRAVTVSVESLGLLLRQCLQEAVAAWYFMNIQPSTDNLQAHASLLFISARDGGLGRLPAEAPTPPKMARPAAPARPAPPTGPPPSDADAPPEDSELPFSLAFLIPVLGAGLSAASMLL